MTKIKNRNYHYIHCIYQLHELDNYGLQMQLEVPANLLNGNYHNNDLVKQRKVCVNGNGEIDISQPKILTNIETFLEEKHPGGITVLKCTIKTY